MESEKQKVQRLLLVEVLKSAPIMFGKGILVGVQTGMWSGESCDSHIQYLKKHKKLIDKSITAPSLEKLPTLVVEALSFATEALHDEYLPHHKFKVPFVAHIYQVIATLINSSARHENVMAAAALHHAVEKGIIGLGDVLALFGEDVWRMVEQLTTVVEFNGKGDEWQRMETRIMRVTSAPLDIKDAVINITAADAIVFGNAITIAQLEGNGMFDADGSIRKFYSKLAPTLLSNLKEGSHLHGELKSISTEVFWR